MWPAFVPLLLGFLPVSIAALERLVLVSRHGERQRLWKDQVTQAEDKAGEGGPRLTAKGAKELVDVGGSLRQRYMRPGCSQARCLEGSIGNGTYVPAEVRAESSGLARTLGSAYALHEGLLPQGSVPSGGLAGSVVVPIPVYSRPKSEDFILRGYTMCSSQERSVENWYSSEQFRNKAEETVELRSRVASALGRTNVTEDDGTGAPLPDWWNTYDELVIAAQAGSPVVNSSDMEEAEELAAWLEAMKFSKKVAGNRCGGPLLHVIGERLDSSKYPELRLLHYSAHYATMLCLLTALGISASSEKSQDSWLTTELLGLSSVLAFEVSSAEEPMVRLHYWPGTDSSDDTWRSLDLPCAGLGIGAAGGCTVSQFKAWATAHGLPTLRAWCRACENFEPERRLCSMTAPTQEDDSVPSQWDLPAIAFVFLGVGMSAFLAVGCYTFRRSFSACFSVDEERRSMVNHNGATIGACSPAPSL